MTATDVPSPETPLLGPQGRRTDVGAHQPRTRHPSVMYHVSRHARLWQQGHTSAASFRRMMVPRGTGIMRSGASAPSLLLPSPFTPLSARQCTCWGKCNACFDVLLVPCGAVEPVHLNAWINDAARGCARSSLALCVQFCGRVRMQQAWQQHRVQQTMQASVAHACSQHGAAHMPGCESRRAS